MGGRNEIMVIASDDDDEVDLAVSGGHVMEGIYDLSEEDTWQVESLSHVSHHHLTLVASCVASKCEIISHKFIMPNEI